MSDPVPEPPGRTTAEYRALLYPNINFGGLVCKLKEYDVPDRYKKLEQAAMELLIVLNQEWEFRLPTKWGPAHTALSNWRATVSGLYYALLEQKHTLVGIKLHRLPKSADIDAAFPVRTRPTQRRTAIFWYRRFINEMKAIVAVETPAQPTIV